MQLAPKAFRPRKVTREKFLETLPGVGKLMTVDDERAQSRAQFEISGNLTENRNPKEENKERKRGLLLMQATNSPRFET